MKTIFFSILILSCFSGTSLAADGPKVTQTQEVKTAIFAGGCFWCMQRPFDELKSQGVLSTEVGYSGGHTDRPTYEQTSAGNTGHREVIRVTYDAKRIKFKELLPVFWKNIDPFDRGGQFCDRGEQYSSAVFYSDESEKRDIAESLKVLKTRDAKFAKIETLVLPAKPFFRGEEYHQSYYEKNPIRYKYYRYQCGRDARLEKIWGPGAKH